LNEIKEEAEKKMNMMMGLSRRRLKGKRKLN